jgi:hypothetical protein
VGEFEELAVKLDRLHHDPQARMGYDYFAGGLRWSDETPEFDEIFHPDGTPEFVGLGWYRALIYHRSTLILDQPNDRFCDLWDKALKLSPNWPGFRPERCDPALSATLNARRDAAERSFDELDARITASQRPAAKASV